MSRTFFFQQNDTKIHDFDEGILFLEPEGKSWKWHCLRKTPIESNAFIKINDMGVILLGKEFYTQ